MKRKVPKRHRPYSAGVLALVLAACDRGFGPPGPQTRATVAPDGKPATLVECYYSPSDCFDAIGRSCPRGYEVLNKAEQQHTTAIVVRCR